MVDHQEQVQPALDSSIHKHEAAIEKNSSEYLEKAEEYPAAAPDFAVANLSPAHREYLLERHGTLELDPIPSASDADPYNWPTWKV